MRLRNDLKRWLFNVAAAVLLLLCVPVIWLWTMGARREAGIRGAYYSGENSYAQVAAYQHIVSFSLAAGRHWPRIRSAQFPALASGFGAVRRGEWGAKLGGLPPLPGNLAFTGVSLDEAIGLMNAPAVRLPIVLIAADSRLILLFLLGLASLFLTLAHRQRWSGAS